jgi:uncharacterized membrane protein required for colicin V production
MSPFDFAMVGIVIAGMIWGAFRGITWQLASMCSLVLGYAVSFPMSKQVAPHFPGDPIVARALALLTIYVGVSGCIFLVAWSIRAVLRRWQFEAYDRHLGMVLGGLEGAALGIVATVFVISLAPNTRQPILGSTAGKVVGGILDAVQPALPGEVRSMLAAHWAGKGDSKETEPTTNSQSLAENIKSSLHDGISDRSTLANEIDSAGTSDGSDSALTDSEIRSLMKSGVTALKEEARKQFPDAARKIDETSDPEVVQSLLKEESGKFGEAIRSNLGDSNKNPRTIKGFLKKSGARIGQAVGDVLNEQADQLGEKIDGRRTERR